METLLGVIFVLVALNVVNSIALIAAVVVMAVELRRFAELLEQLKNLCTVIARRARAIQ